MPEETKARTDAERLTAVEDQLKRYDGAQERLLDRQLKTITIVFQFVAALLLLITLGTAILSRVDANQLERRFEALAGKGLPSLLIQYDGKALDGQVIEAKMQGAGFALAGFELKNIGDSSTSFVNIRFHFGQRFQSMWSMYEEVPPLPDLKQDFPSAVFWNAGSPTLVISPRETWSIGPLTGSFPQGSAAPTEVKAKAVIFYGRDRPSTADFTIRLVL